MTHYSNLDYFMSKNLEGRQKPLLFFGSSFACFLTLLISKLDKVADIEERFLERLR